MDNHRKNTLQEEQIAELQTLLATELCDALYDTELPEALIGQVIETQGKAIVAACVADLLKRVEAVSNMIVRRVRVDRSRTSQAAIDATGRVQYVNNTVVDAMPIGEGEEVDVYTFKPDPEAYVKGVISPAEVERQFYLRGLKPDPRAQAAMNEDDPSFTDEHPNGTQWPRPDGGYDFVTFGRWGVGDRSVRVGRGGFDWPGGWWFAGVRK